MRISQRAAKWLTWATLVGGDLVCGRRVRAYTLLASLLILLCAAWVAQIFTITFGLASRPSLVAGATYIIGLGLIWFWNAHRATKNKVANHAAYAISVRRVLEASLASAATWILVVGSVASFALPPVGAPSWSDTRIAGGKRLFAADGSVRLTGELWVRDRPAANQALVLVFNGGITSEDIWTDQKGHFEWTLPPGTWVLKGPMLVGRDVSRVAVEVDPPMAGRELIFNVSQGPPRQTYFLKIVAE